VIKAAYRRKVIGSKSFHKAENKVFGQKWSFK
jgi:hypothetical protein